MSSKVNLKYFVGGIPSDVQHKDLYEFFKTLGVIKRITIFNSDKGKKLFGFCFVKFKKLFVPDLADKSTVYQFQGRNLDIDPIVRRSNLKQAVNQKHSKRIFLQNVPRHFTQDDLMEVFKAYGKIVNCFLIDREGGSRASDHGAAARGAPIHDRKNNYGYVIFQNSEDAEILVNKKFIELRDRSRIYIKKYCSTINRNQAALGQQEKSQYRDHYSADVTDTSPLYNSICKSGSSSEERDLPIDHGLLPTRAAYGQSRPTLPCQSGRDNLRFNVGAF